MLRCEYLTQFGSNTYCETTSAHASRGKESAVGLALDHCGHEAHLQPGNGLQQVPGASTKRLYLNLIILK